MGFFDALFRKKKNFEKTSLENLEQSVQKKIQEKNENFKQEATNYLSRIGGQEKKLKEKLSRLSAAQVTEQIDPQLFKIAMTSRKNFVGKVENLIADEQKDFSIHYLAEFSNSFFAKFREVDAGTVSEYASIKEVFKNESPAVIDEMKGLRKIYSDFAERLKRAESEVLPFEEIETKIQILNQETKKLENCKKYLGEIQQRNEMLKKESEMMQKNLQSLESGEEWKNYLEMKKRLEERESERKEVISNVVERFSSVERPLKKLNNFLQQSESEINKKILEKYFSSPFDAFVDDYEKKTINLALKEAEKMIAEKKIINEEKSLGKIREMISSDTFVQLAKKWQKTNDEIAELNEKIESSEVNKKRDEILATISNHETEISQSGKEKTEQQIKNVEQDFSIHKEELKQLAKDNMNLELEL